MLIYKAGGEVQKFHTFSTVLLFAASGGAFVVVGLDTGFCGRVQVISFDISTTRTKATRNNSERPVDALAENGKSLTHSQFGIKRC